MIGIYKDRRALGGEISLPKISAPTSPRFEILSSILSSYKPGIIQGQKFSKDQTLAIKTNESQRRFSYSVLEQQKEVEQNNFNVTHHTQTDDEELGNIDKTPFASYTKTRIEKTPLNTRQPSSIQSNMNKNQHQEIKKHKPRGITIGNDTSSLKSLSNIQMIGHWESGSPTSAISQQMKRMTSNDVQLMENLRQMELQQQSIAHSKPQNHVIISRTPTMIVPKSLHAIKQ